MRKPHGVDNHWRFRLRWPVLVLAAWLWGATGQAADWREPLIRDLRGGAAMVTAPDGRVLFSHHAERAMVPASIIKIATADAALTRLGSDYRFKTELYLTPDRELAIKGYGDPGLVSEQLQAIAQQLAREDLPPLRGMVLDTGYFSGRLTVRGQTRTDNPYDAKNGALVANFNTLYVRKDRRGGVVSAEPQTPLTATAEALAKTLPAGEQRINLGASAATALHYFAELLRAFLEREGVRIGTAVRHAPVAPGSRLLLTHRSAPLPETVRGMLEYSNNFVANQLLLVLGAERSGPPATLAKGVRTVSEFLSGEVGLRRYRLVEGSGLSRENRIDAREMIALLQHFVPYKALLKARDGVFHAKTGTLKGVSTYAGYMESASGELYPFAILLDRPVGFHYRFGIARRLYDRLVQPAG
jgi:D-alanyl-D-alanine carboxypeptidase/D-alanyl-D-alanine-endopeptidase (penicillin-binding protein 4)